MSNSPKGDLLDLAHECIEHGALDAARGILQLHDNLNNPNIQGLMKALSRTTRQWCYNLHRTAHTKLYRERLNRGWTIQQATDRLGDIGDKTRLVSDVLRAYEKDVARAAKAPRAHIELIERLYSKRWEDLCGPDRDEKPAKKG